MPGTLSTNWLDALNWNTSTGGAAGVAETTNTLGQDRQDNRVPPDNFHVGGLQLARMRQLLQSMSQFYLGGCRLQVLTQSANPFGAGEVGYYADNTATPNPRFSALGTLTSIANGAVTAKGDLCIYNGTNFAVLAVGSNTQVLTADSTQATGIKWAAAPGASTGNWTFTGNNADLTGAGAMGIGNIGPTATSVVFGPGTLTLKANTTLGMASQAATNTTAVQWSPNVADGASTVVEDHNNQTTIATSGASFFRIRNNAAAAFNIVKGGNGTLIYGSGGATANIQIDDTNGIILSPNANNNIQVAFNTNTTNFTNAGAASAAINGNQFSRQVGEKYHQIATQTTTYQILITDFYVPTDTTTAGFTVTLPAPATVGSGATYIISDTTNQWATHNLTLARNSTEKINNSAANLTLNTAGQRVLVWTNGTDWFTLRGT